MLFNADKYKVMHIGYNNFHADYFMSGNKLNTVSEEKDPVSYTHSDAADE